MKKYAVIVAGGSGSRLGTEIPKQFLDLNGFPMLWWSLFAFHEENPSTTLIVVLPGDYIEKWKSLLAQIEERFRIPHLITTGGKNRSDSVRNGLSLIDDDDSLVAVHDAARPLITKVLIESAWKAAGELKAVIPVIPVTDSLRYIGEDESKAVDRDKYRAVQTPQVFETKILKQAYQTFPKEIFSDDATAVENMGIKIHLISGDSKNMKVTNPGDIETASRLMRETYGSIS